MTASKKPSQSNSPVAVRRARGTDAADIARIYVASWQDTYAGILPTERLVRMSAQTQTRVWAYQIRRSGVASPVLVGEAPSGEIVGFSSGGKARQSWARSSGEIYTLYVEGAWYDQGIGRALLETMLAALGAAGHRHVVVWVLADNPARFFYQAMGGKSCGRRTERFWGADHVELAYGWDVPASR